MAKKANYIPAMKFKALTSIFDPFIRITMPEVKIKKELIEKANLVKGDVVLDFGCGTGTLMIMMKSSKPEVNVFGVDIDKRIIEIARKKVENANVDVSLMVYDGVILPYQDQTFDKVFSSLVFHHLTRKQKSEALKEIFRVLKYDGTLNIVDFGKSRNFIINMFSFLPRLLDGLENTRDNFKGMIPEILKEEGFNNVQEMKGVDTVFGSLSFYTARKSTK